MKVIIDKLPLDATLPEAIRAYNILADKLNLAFDNIDEENISESVLEEINKED